MTDYSAHDIHLLDQAYPDALADIEEFIGNPANKRCLAEQGAEVYAAELTRALSASFDNPTSLAGWAAIATVRLMEAGKTWEEDTEMAYEQRDAARAMADELRTELAKARDGHDKAARQWAHARAEVDRLHEQLANARHTIRNLAQDYADATGEPLPEVAR